MQKIKYIWVMILMIILLAACGGGESADAPSPEVGTDSVTMAEEVMDEEMETAADETIDETTDETMSEPAAESGAEHDATSVEMETVDEEMDESLATADLAPWQSMTLTDAVSGESFTLADYAGQTVFVEPMATWCTNCRRQLGNVQETIAQLGEDVVFVALSVETTISDDVLAEYSLNNGFDMKFAVLNGEMLQALADTFGTTVANPPSTPHFIIRPDGTLTELVTGFESPAELIESIQAAQG